VSNLNNAFQSLINVVKPAEEPPAE